ncbi:MAG: type II toxin-antitoxin system HicB family antitoxin [Polyangiales bacterium]
MRFEGRVLKAGKWWSIEVPDLGAFSQGRTRKDAYAMIRDAIEAMIDKPGLSIDLHRGKGSYFEVSSTDDAALVAFFLKQQRGLSGKTLEQVVHNLGQTSVNAYARYEQGASVPTIDKLTELLRALDPDADFVLRKSVIHKGA